MAGLQYCLRWNYHRSNLITVFDLLFQNEEFTDVTLACKGPILVKCHKMILATGSPYFQRLLTELPCEHPVVVLHDVRLDVMKAILEYMYRGEVTVAQDQLAAFLKVAKALSVKGLVAENGGSGNEGKQNENGDGVVCLSSSSEASPSRGVISVEDLAPLSACANFPSQNGVRGSRNSSKGIWSSSAMSQYFGASSDVSPMSRRAPILRTAFGQVQASSQVVPIIHRPDSCDKGKPKRQEQQVDQINVESSSGDSPSPFSDISSNEEDNNERPAFNSHFLTMVKTMLGEAKGLSTNNATDVTSEAEWKRYKQYQPNDILLAIKAIKNGMNTAKAARTFAIPARTLYDKARKLGIPSSRGRGHRNSSVQLFSGSGGSADLGVPFISPNVNAQDRM